MSVVVYEDNAKRKQNMFRRSNLFHKVFIYLLTKIHIWYFEYIEILRNTLTLLSELASLLEACGQRARQHCEPGSV